MIALWMLHAAALGLLLTVAGLAAERALRLLGRPTRWVWAATLALGISLPLLRLPSALPSAPGTVADRAADATRLDLSQLPSDARLIAPGPLARLTAWLTVDVVEAPAEWRALDRPLALGWIAVGALLALRTAVASRRMSARLQQWPRVARDGLTLHVAPDLGPAVFGAVRPTVIVPRWALDDDRLPLMLAHEAAHLRARDPLLLLTGLVAAILLPWSAAAWWQLRRLRLAVELDCDARVLAAADAPPTAVHAYGALLLDVARRSTAARPLAALAPTLLATPSTLSRRIHAMTAPRPRHAVRRALPLTAGAALLVAAACELPRPTGPRTEPRIPLTQLTAPVATVDLAPITDADVRRVVGEAFPGALTERRGEKQRLWIVQEGTGRISRVMRGLVGAGAQGELTLEDAELAVEQRGTYVRGRPSPSGTSTLAGVPADQIASVDVRKLAPGRLVPDSAESIWIRLKGADALTAPAAAKAPTRMRAPATDRAAVTGTPRTLKVRAAADTGGRKPLYVVDGVEIDGAPASLPKPDRIEAIDVIKGAAAEREYGARAAAGVIRITTKKN
ncbi:MAG: M56 family metallopeptidase [Gemmatirosa sp.]